MLPVEDVRYLTEKGYDYVCEPGGSGHLLVIKSFALPPGMTPNATDLLLEIPGGYPDAGLDMFWVHPEVRVTATGAYPPAAEQFESKLQGLSWSGSPGMAFHGSRVRLHRLASRRGQAKSSARR